MTSNAGNHPLVALRALGALARSPDDLTLVFTVIGNLPGRTPERVLARFRASPDGRGEGTRRGLTSTKRAAKVYGLRFIGEFGRADQGERSSSGRRGS